MVKRATGSHEEQIRALGRICEVPQLSVPRALIAGSRADSRSAEPLLAVIPFKLHPSADKPLSTIPHRASVTSQYCYHSITLSLPIYTQ